MTARVPGRGAVRAGGGPLAHAAVLACLAALSASLSAQTTAWELVPIPTSLGRGTGVDGIGFLRGEGAAANDPAADTLVMIGSYGAMLYNPSGVAGAAGDNGEWHTWHRLYRYISADTGLVTPSGTILVNGTQFYGRGTRRGRDWVQMPSRGDSQIFQSTLPGLVGPTGHPALFLGTGFGGFTVRSFDDGVTWQDASGPYGFPERFGEVPPSPSLPNGRILYATDGGPLYSDDGGLTYTRATMSPPAAHGFFLTPSFAFVPVAGHPFGGALFAGIHEVEQAVYGPSATVYRSDDGGTTYTLRHAFTEAETGLPFTNGAYISDTRLFATPDGALWAGVGMDLEPVWPLRRRGGIMRSADLGATWQRADTGFDAVDGRGFSVNQFLLGRDGRLYAATEYGVWRTTGPAVASEAGPARMPGVRVAVRPNPASGRVRVAVSLAAASTVRVAVFDATGREVAVPFDGMLAAGEREVPVETGGWPAGVYVVRVTAAGGGGGAAGEASARFTVAR